MRVSGKFIEADSVEKFVDEIRVLSTAGASVIHARTDEIARALSVMRESLIRDGHTYTEWDVLHGAKSLEVSNYREHAGVTGNGNLDFTAEFEEPLKEAINRLSSQEEDDSEVFRYFVYVNPQFWIENNPVVAQLLVTYEEILPTTTTRIILVTPDEPLPEDTEQRMTTVRMTTPGISELMKSLDYLLESSSIGEEELFGRELSDSEKFQICYAGAGLSKSDFELYTSWAIASSVYHGGEDAEHITLEEVIKGISRGKTEIVSRSDILELIPSGDIAEVGGMALLKEWIYKRRNCFTDEAEEFGIEPPKGIVCVGVPGTGKSLISKAIAGVFGVPVVRLDFGRVFNAYVGKSEERVRKALEMAQAMAPCVLFIDEVEKGLSGTSGGGDSGTSSRVLGTFLTWLQDNTAPVFTVVTANNIANLPPELTRRGRFDAIFASTLPGVKERIEVIKIHLKKRGRREDHFTKKEYEDLAISCKGFVPAEIEAAIKDALVTAFSNSEDLEAKHIKAEMQNLIPLSTSHAEHIAKIIAWAKINALPTSDDTSEHLESEVKEDTSRKRVRLDPTKKTKLH